MQVAGNARSGYVLIHPPEQRDVRIHGPVLQIIGTEVIDAPDAPFIDELPGEGDGRHAAVVEPHGIELPALLRGGRHAFGLAAIHGHRLLAGHDLARLQRGDGNIVMRVIGRADIDDADLRIVDDGPPVGDGIFPAPALGHLLDFGLFAAADGLEAGSEGKIEKLVDLAIGVRMGLAHELVADHSHGNGFSHRCPLEKYSMVAKAPQVARARLLTFAF